MVIKWIVSRMNRSGTKALLFILYILSHVVNYSLNMRLNRICYEISEIYRINCGKLRLKDYGSN